jgi:hypothetical protein
MISLITSSATDPRKLNKPQLTKKKQQKLNNTNENTIVDGNVLCKRIHSNL